MPQLSTRASTANSDLWVHQWRHRRACGRVVIVRYADDFVMGFEAEADARRMRADLQQRLAGFGLALHEDKTRLIEFGRLPAIARRRRGERHPETFAFLGFTHYCGWTRDGRFIVKHKKQSRRLTRKLTALRQEAWRIMHRPLAEQHRWYASVLRGHYGYYGMPHNYRALSGFQQAGRRIWFMCLRRRSQKSRTMGWDTFDALIARFPLPKPRITHPWAVRQA
jgi:RNA-directed DNA polymerase